MERVRVVFFGCLLALGLLFCPSAAYASDGFLGGLEDLIGVREVEVTEDYEQEYSDEYEPQLRADPADSSTNALTELTEDATTVDYVNVTLDEFNKVQVGSNRVELRRAIQYMLGHYSGWAMPTLLILPAASLVFMWWGVRKCIQLVISSFRKGSLNI